MSALHMFHEQTEEIISETVWRWICRKIYFLKAFKIFSKRPNQAAPVTQFNLQSSFEDKPLQFWEAGGDWKAFHLKKSRNKNIWNRISTSPGKNTPCKCDWWRLQKGKALQGRSLITCDLTKEEKSGKGAFQMRCNYSYVTDFEEILSSNGCSTVVL